MEHESNVSKRRYDITMSKRTRKPLNLDRSGCTQDADCEEPPLESFLGLTRKPSNLDQFVYAQDAKCEETPENFLKQESNNDHLDQKVEEDEDEADRKSLKELIDDDGDGNGSGGSGGDRRESRSGRSSLGHHFTEEEKQMQLVKTQQQQDGMRLKGMVSRYVKVLTHLVKVKREPRTRLGSRTRHLLRLAT